MNEDRTILGGQLALRAIIDHELQTFPIRDDLMIGSDPSCDIVIPNAKPRHAFVRVDEQGPRLIEYEPDARIESQIWPLSPANTLVIARTIFDCVPYDASSQAADAILPLDRHACPRCRANLVERDLSARFCPHCGAPLPADCPAWPVVTDDPSPEPEPPVRWWMKWIPASLRTRAARDPLFFARPTTVLAYINTLLNLGLRYEAGANGNAQPAEAMRCYKKAASLGNIPARARLKIKFSNTK
jgi:hypothetical protein